MKSDKNVKKLAEAYTKMREDKGDQQTRDVLSGARAAAVGIIRPVESAAALRLYQETEKAVFGDLGPLNEGEKDLTNAGIETHPQGQDPQAPPPMASR